MKLQFGMVGGGNGAFIGNVHRKAAQMDDLAELAAGCFSRNQEKNQETAEAWNVKDPSRIYSSWKEMADKEAQRENKIDFVVIVTPTNTHYEIAKYYLEAGFHVVCDKPIALTAGEGAELKRIAAEKDLLFGVTYTYASYAVIRQAREMIEAGKIGQILKIEAEYPQDWVLKDAALNPDASSVWRLDPKQAGPSACCADIGTHLEALIKQMTGLHPKRVLARLNHVKGSVLEHDLDAFLEFDNQIPGHIWASQVAAGNDCGVKIRVFGDQGSLEWAHQQQMELRYSPLTQPTQILLANNLYNYDACREQCRLPVGHPEGFHEAFGNIYRACCRHLLEKKTGECAGDFRYPTIDDGIAGLRFVDACLESDAGGNIWVEME